MEKQIISKGELVKKTAEKVAAGSTGFVANVIDAMLDVIIDEVSAGNEIRLSSFGTFKAVDKKERTGRNPQTGEEIKIPAHKLPIFKPSKYFKGRLN